VFLRLQLTEALNIQDEALAAQIHEALRCVRLFDDAGYVVLIFLKKYSPTFITV
jgi:hypothetical protein